MLKVPFATTIEWDASLRECRLTRATIKICLLRYMTVYYAEFLKVLVEKRVWNLNKKVQLDVTICRHLFTAKSLYMFRASQHPSSGVLKSVTATSGIGHNTGTATSFQRGRLRTVGRRWKEVAVPVVWPMPEVAVTIFSTPNDGCCDARNM